MKKVPEKDDQKTSWNYTFMILEVSYTFLEL